MSFKLSTKNVCAALTFATLFGLGLIRELRADFCDSRCRLRTQFGYCNPAGGVPTYFTTAKPDCRPCVAFPGQLPYGACRDSDTPVGTCQKTGTNTFKRHLSGNKVCNCGAPNLETVEAILVGNFVEDFAFDLSECTPGGIIITP